MYALYGDWMLAIAAYNCGPGNVNKAIRRSGGKTDFWQIYQYLPRETRSYVPFYRRLLRHGALRRTRYQAPYRQ